jgi:hypothetical protein
MSDIKKGMRKGICQIARTIYGKIKENKNDYSGARHSAHNYNSSYLSGGDRRITA